MKWEVTIGLKKIGKSEFDLMSLSDKLFSHE